MTNESKARTPPYASFKSFSNFLEHLRSHPPMPPRIDKSVMSNLNYGTQQALIAAMESLALVDGQGAPTDRLERLVKAKESQRAPIMLEAIKEGYPYFFASPFDLTRATPDQFTERIRKEGKVTGSTTTKAISFFIAAATAAGLTLSPHLMKRKQAVRRASSNANGSAATSAARSPKPKRQQKGKTKPNGSDHESGATPSMVDQLLKKFPEFDPKWDDKLKAKWFEGFERLMGSAGVKERS